MNLNKKISLLLNNGFTSKFISTLNESKINLLFEKMSKKENKEATQIVTTLLDKTKPEDLKLANFCLQNQSDPKCKNVKLTEDDSEEETNINWALKGRTQEPKQVGPDTDDGMDDYDDGTGQISEKFESKAQQKLFWARCNKCKTEDCKWCKMAKEFSKSTSKKQYKTMPEKKHPEKTIKYKKKETKESYLDMVQSGALGGYRENLGKVSPSLKFDAALKEHVENIIIKDLQPAMKKKDLMKLIEGELRKRKSLKEDFYYEETELDEDVTMNDPFAPTIEPGIKPKIKPSREKEPEWSPEEDEPMIPNPEVEPEPQAKKRSKFSMNDPFAPTIEPGIKPRIKPDREKEPEWSPEEDEPIVPNPEVDPEPQARGGRHMSKFRDEFYEAMKRMDEAYHKPLKYLK